MQETILSIMGQYGYIGVFLLIAAENIFPPIPSEVILLFGGFMTTYTALHVPGVAAAATLGALLGALVLYAVGRIFNRERLQRIVTGRLGRMLHLKADDIGRADDWFSQKGNKTVFFCRFIPIVRSLISIPAGMNGMAMPRFLLYTTAGSLVWNFVLVAAGSIVGANWESILTVMDVYAKLAASVIALACFVGGVWFYRSRIAARHE